MKVILRRQKQSKLSLSAQKQKQNIETYTCALLDADGQIALYVS